MLVNSQGFSLHDFSGDGFDAVTGCLPTNMSAGTACTSVWRPAVATGPLVAGRGSPALA